MNDFRGLQAGQAALKGWPSREAAEAWLLEAQKVLGKPGQMVKAVRLLDELTGAAEQVAAAKGSARLMRRMPWKELAGVATAAAALQQVCGDKQSTGGQRYAAVLASFPDAPTEVGAAAIRLGGEAVMAAAESGSRRTRAAIAAESDDADVLNTLAFDKDRRVRKAAVANPDTPKRSRVAGWLELNA